MSGPAESAAGLAVSFLRTRYMAEGGAVQVNARRSEVPRATVIVIARARKKVPVTPVMEMRGRRKRQ